MFIGNMNVPREYVYLPNAACMVIELASREDAYGQNWHIPGTDVISGKEIVEMLYLTEEPLVLRGKKYERFIGPIPVTSYEKGITDTIHAIKHHQSQTKK